MFRFRLISSARILREADLLDSKVFVGGSLTILGSDIVLKSGSSGSSTLYLFIEFGGSVVTDSSEFKECL